MIDMTKCLGEGCANREQCYRYTARPDDLRQSFFANAPIVNGQCAYFVRDSTTQGKAAAHE